MAEIPQGAAAPLAAGKVIGGRFEVEDRDPASLVGDLYRAKDKKTNRRVFLHVLGPALYATPQAHELLRQAVRVASALTHRNVVATFGMGTEPGGIRYVATEFVDGRRLTDLVAAKVASGHGFSIRTAYNLVAHVLNALTYAHATTLHAAITPSTVFVNRSGRVKVAGFGILTALAAPERARLAAERGETAFLAPELTQGGNLDVRADVYGAASLLYLLLTGQAPGGRFERPSAERADVSPAVDELLARALAMDPATRPADAASFKSALQEIVRAAGVPGDAGIDVELDLETASMPPPAPAQPVAVAPEPPPPPPPPAAAAAVAAPGAPKVGDRVSIHEAFRVDTKPVTSAPPRASKVDFDSLLQNVASQDAERWMVQKDKLDHGPFSPRSLIQQILQGQVSEDDNLLNMDTGERRKVKAWPEFKEFVARYKKQKAEEDKRLAIEASGRAETRGNFAKYFIAFAVFLVIGAGVTIFFITRQAGQSGPRTPDELADLFQPGRIEIQGTAGLLPMRRGGGGGGGGGHRGGGGGGGGGGRGGSYEDAMNQAADMGNAEQGGGERQLTANDIARVLNGRLSMFRSCIVQEARAMPSTRNCSMDIAIAGSGQVLGVSVTTGSGSFKSCVSGKVRSVHFPSFPAPRMGARFGFSW